MDNTIPFPSQDKVQADLEKLKRSLPSIGEYMELMAKLHKIKYDALISQGFNNQQALELCKSLL